MAVQELTEEEARQHRSRLIDHFKRAYQIIVGLAITLACGKVFAGGSVDFNDPALFMFAAFFVTVVPIFHGGDRSLDLKYLGAKITLIRDQIGYVWDVYMLMITAIFFVKIAQAIPGPGLSFIGSPSSTDPAHFYQWMAGMLLFDMVVLIVDGAKSGLLGTRGAGELRVYPAWVVLNFVVAMICLYAPQSGLSAQGAGILVLLAACIRTVLDYAFGRKFMFP